MEDPDPQLRQSLKEMLFDGDAFRWSRLEDLVSSAASQAQLDLDTLWINYLISSFRQRLDYYAINW